MATTIRVEIVSAEAEIFHGEAAMVVAAGEMGELGIAPRHAPLITRLKPGQVRVIQADGEEIFATVVVRTGVAPGSVFLTPSALQEGPVDIRAREAVAG